MGLGFRVYIGSIEGFIRLIGVLYGFTVLGYFGFVFTAIGLQLLRFVFSGTPSS